MTTIHIMCRGEEWTCDAVNIGGLVTINPRTKWNNPSSRDGGHRAPFGRLEFDAHELGEGAR